MARSQAWRDLVKRENLGLKRTYRKRTAALKAICQWTPGPVDDHPCIYRPYSQCDLARSCPPHISDHSTQSWNFRCPSTPGASFCGYISSGRAKSINVRTIMNILFHRLAVLSKQSMGTKKKEKKKELQHLLSILCRIVASTNSYCVPATFYKKR